MQFPGIERPWTGALFLLLAAASSGVQADTNGDGRPQIGIEFEHEKAADHSWRANSVTLAPGIKWDDGWLTMLELLLEAEREMEAGNGHHTHGKGGIRLRKDIPIASQWRSSLRGLVGHASEGRPFTYAYIEPALKYDSDIGEFTIGYRMVRSVDGSRGHDLNKLRLGPSFDLGRNHEIEFRWARSWDAHTGEHASDAYSIELVHRF